MVQPWQTQSAVWALRTAPSVRILSGKGRHMERKLVIALVIAAGAGLVWLTSRGNPPVPEPAGDVAVLFSDEPSSAEADSGLSFDPAAVARAEAKMWRAYYDGRPQEVFVGLTEVLRGQAGLGAADASRVAMHFSMAAATFREVSGNYETTVLPGLVAGYEAMRDATGRDFDASAAAEAELRWWVLRRTPGRDSPESVGRAIARMYSELYGASNADIALAGLLRAKAAELRDGGGDWAEVERLLTQSNEALLSGIAQGNPR